MYVERLWMGYNSAYTHSHSAWTCGMLLVRNTDAEPELDLVLGFRGKNNHVEAACRGILKIRLFRLDLEFRPNFDFRFSS